MTQILLESGEEIPENASCPKTIFKDGRHNWLMFNPKTRKRRANWRCLECGKTRRARS